MLAGRGLQGWLIVVIASMHVGKERDEGAGRVQG
jgi:hypothetical protein